MVIILNFFLSTVILISFFSCSSAETKNKVEISFHTKDQNQFIVTYKLPVSVEQILLQNLSLQRVRGVKFDKKEFQLSLQSNKLSLRANRGKTFKNFTLIFDMNRLETLKEFQKFGRGILFNPNLFTVSDKSLLGSRFIIKPNLGEAVYVDDFQKIFHKTAIIQNSKDRIVYLGKELGEKKILFSNKIKPREQLMIKKWLSVLNMDDELFPIKNINKIFVKLGKENNVSIHSKLMLVSLKRKDLKKVRKTILTKVLRESFMQNLGPYKFKGELYELFSADLDLLVMEKLKTLGLLKKQNILDHLNSSITNCIMGPNDHSRRSCEKSKTIMLKGMLNKNLSTVWKELSYIEKDEKKLDHFLDFLELNSRDDSQDFRKILSHKFDQNGEDLYQFFLSTKFKILRSNNYDKKTYEKLGLSLIKQLYNKNCQGKKGVKAFSRTVFVDGKKECDGFNKDFYIFSINGHHIFRNAFKAYEYTRRSCVTKGYVDLYNMSKKRLRVNCFDLSGPLTLFKIKRL